MSCNKCHCEKEDERNAAIVGALHHPIPKLQHQLRCLHPCREVSDEPWDAVQFRRDLTIFKMLRNDWIVVEQQNFDQCQAWLERVEVII